MVAVSASLLLTAVLRGTGKCHPDFRLVSRRLFTDFPKIVVDVRNLADSLVALIQGNFVAAEGGITWRKGQGEKLQCLFVGHRHYCICKGVAVLVQPRLAD